MKKYQLITVVHTIFSTNIIPDAFVYSSMEDALNQVGKMIASFAEGGERIEYKGKLTSVNDIFTIVQEKFAGGDFSEVFIYELEVR